MATYAKRTKVSVDKTRDEIERTLRRYGASGFMYGWQGRNAQIAFEIEEPRRMVRFTLLLPDPNDDEFTLTDTGRERNENQAFLAYEQAVRQRWRALALVIKAKLEAIDAGIAIFDDEFMPYLVLPSGRTVAEEVGTKVVESIESGKSVPLLPGPKPKGK